MNKILVAARLAKGLSQKYIAGKLKIQESVYKELYQIQLGSMELGLRG